jgi:hypothetical protein
MGVHVCSMIVLDVEFIGRFIAKDGKLNSKHQITVPVELGI